VSRRYRSSVRRACVSSDNGAEAVLSHEQYRAYLILLIGDFMSVRRCSPAREPSPSGFALRSVAPDEALEDAQHHPALAGRGVPQDGADRAVEPVLHRLARRYSFKKFGDGKAERVGDALKGVEADLSPVVLDAAQVAGVDGGGRGQLPLGQAPGLAFLPDSAADERVYAEAGAFHWRSL